MNHIYFLILHELHLYFRACFFFYNINAEGGYFTQSSLYDSMASAGPFQHSVLSKLIANLKNILFGHRIAKVLRPGHRPLFSTPIIEVIKDNAAELCVFHEVCQCLWMK